MSKSKPLIYGGQALIEGVMMGGGKHTVSAIRRNDGSVEYYYAERKQHPTLQKLKKTGTSTPAIQSLSATLVCV